MTEKQTYCPGDCVVVELGEITLNDGRVIRGVVLEFPVSPPNLPFSVVWDGTPLTLSIKKEDSP